MKKILLTFVLIPFVANAQSVFYCGKLKGYDTLGKPAFLENLHKTETADNGCKYIIDGQSALVSCSELGTVECITLDETDEKIDFVCPGSIASSIYTISKKENNWKHI